MLDMDKFDALQISIASPKRSEPGHMEKSKNPKPSTTERNKPERDGLFCERIFGPQKDWNVSAENTRAFVIAASFVNAVM
jgi:DNA-directed RNA polymerase subunit beta'